MLDARPGEGKAVKGLYTGKGKPRTKAIPKTLSPSWEEEFHFRHTEKGCWLTVTVWDEDKWDGDDKLGGWG